MIMGGLRVAGDGPVPGDQGVVGSDCVGSPGGGPCVGAGVEAKRDVGLAVGDE